MKIRMANEQDAERIIEWSRLNIAKNGFDPAVLLYPTTDIVVAENGTGPVLYMPVQLVGMLESLAPSPDATAESRSRALLAALRHIAEVGMKRGARELYFLASDAELAEQAERAGFERCEWPAYKLRLGEP